MFFFFLSPNYIFLVQWEVSADPLEADGFSPIVILWFLGALGHPNSKKLLIDTTSLMHDFYNKLRK